MVIGENMENKNYLMVQDNVVVNVVVWNGDTQQWTPPNDALMLVQETTPAFDWQYVEDLQDFELVENIGGGNIGDTWNGTSCITSQEKPPKPEPIPTPAGGEIPSTTV